MLPNAWYFYDARVPFRDGSWVPLDDCFEYGHARILNVLCSTVASQHLRLKQILVYIPCYCSADDAWAKHSRESKIDIERCFPADGLARILEPIRKLRVRRIRFLHECMSPHIAELQGVFQDLTDTVQSSTTGNTVSSDEIEWCNLWQEAQRSKPLSYTVKRHLKEAWRYMNNCFTNWHRPAVGPEMYQQRSRHHLGEARQDLARRTWDEELMLKVAMLSDLHERESTWMSHWWDEESMLSVASATFLS